MRKSTEPGHLPCQPYGSSLGRYGRSPPGLHCVSFTGDLYYSLLISLELLEVKTRHGKECRGEAGGRGEPH